MRRAARNSGGFALALALAGCLPLRVDIEEQAAGYLAVAHGGDAEECQEAQERIAAEARYFCEARAHNVTLGRIDTETIGEGCTLEMPFWCTAQ